MLAKLTQQVRRSSITARVVEQPALHGADRVQHRVRGGKAADSQLIADVCGRSG